MVDRLFVPLNKEWFDLFEQHRKDWEIRGISARFNEKTVRIGRKVELRRGYQKKGALWGTIVDYMITENITDLPEEVIIRAIPKTLTPAMQTELDIYNEKYPSFITFKVVLG